MQPLSTHYADIETDYRRERLAQSMQRTGRGAVWQALHDLLRLSHSDARETRRIRRATAH